MLTSSLFSAFGLGAVALVGTGALAAALGWLAQAMCASLGL